MHGIHVWLAPCVGCSQLSAAAGRAACPCPSASPGSHHKRTCGTSYIVCQRDRGCSSDGNSRTRHMLLCLCLGLCGQRTACHWSTQGQHRAIVATKGGHKGQLPLTERSPGAPRPPSRPQGQSPTVGALDRCTRFDSIIHTRSDAKLGDLSVRAGLAITATRHQLWEPVFGYALIQPTDAGLSIDVI